MTWQLIETAPKNYGAVILGWRKGWSRPVELFLKDNGRTKKVYWSNNDELDDYDQAMPENQPTHWHPLPEPPNVD